MPISYDKLKYSHRGLFGTYLTTSGGSFDMNTDFSVTPATFSLFHDQTVDPIVVKEIEINMSTSGKVLLAGFGSGAQLISGMVNVSSGSNGLPYTQTYYLNNDLFDLTNDIFQFDFQTGFTFYKLRVSFINVSEPVYDSRNGDNISITLNDDMTSRVVGLNWFVTGHYV